MEQPPEDAQPSAEEAGGAAAEESSGDGAAAEEAPPTAAKDAIDGADGDGDDDDLDLDADDDDAAAGDADDKAAASPAAAAAAADTDGDNAAAAGDAPEAAADTADGDGDDDDDDLDLDDSEEEQPSAAKQPKRKRARFIDDSADESDDEAGTKDGEEDDEGDDAGANNYQLDDFVVNEAEDEDARAAKKKADGNADENEEDGEEDEEEDEETRMARKRKQAEREEQEAEDMVSELKELARDRNIEIEMHQKKKRLKGRTEGTGDKDLEEEMEGVIEEDADKDDEDAMQDEEDAKLSIQAEYRDEAAGMFDMSEYDQLPDIGDEGEEDDQEGAEGDADDDDEEVDEKYKHIDKADLADNFMTKSDEEIEFADGQGRLKLNMRVNNRPVLSGEPLTKDELEEEAQWIYARAFDQRPDQVAPSGDRIRLDVTTVANVLRHALVDKEDAPHILRYRKQSIMQGGLMMLNEADVWKILRWDARWDHFAHRQKMLLATAAKLGDELDDEYLQMLKEAQKDEHLTDMENFLKLQTQMRGPAEGAGSKGPKGAVAKAQAAGLGKFVEQFGLTAFQFGVNVSLEMKKNDVEDHERMPEDLAQDFVCDAYPDADSVLRGSCNMLARQIADEPHVRRHVRSLYRTNMFIATKPTTRGKENISPTDRLNGIRHIRKQIEDLRGQEFLLIMEAEKGRLIEVVLESSDPNWRSNMQQESEDLFLSDRENEVAAKWNEQRKIALTKAIENMLLPAMQQELRSELEFEARERLCDSYRERFTKRIMRGPYSHRGAGQWDHVKEDDETRGIKVLACVWDRDMKVNRDPTPVTCVLLNREGEHRETLELPFMQLPDSDRRKQDSCKLLKEFAERHKPDVACLATNGRASESLYQILLLTLCPLGDLTAMPPPVFIDDEPARIFQHSKRAMEELADQNTLVKLAIAVGRLAHDPLCEVANLVCDAKDFEQLMVHPLQDMLDTPERMKIADECMVDAVNAFGVDINMACRSKHSSALLRFVSGLGPRKAKSIYDVVSSSPAHIELRTALYSQKLVAKTVYNSCAGFIRVDHGRLNTDIDYRSDIELLDNVMIHPDVGYDYGKKMATDALDIEVEDGDDAQETNHKAIMEIMKRPDSLDDLDLDAYASQLEDLEEGVGANMLQTLEDIKAELKTKWYERQLPWKPLENQELFQAIAGFQGRDVFVGESEAAYYEGDIDQKNAYVQLDCQLRARLPVDNCENDTYMLAPEVRFKFGEPRFYMMYKCELAARSDLDVPRIMIDVTRNEQGNEWGPGLNSSVEYECGILCDHKYALTRQNEDKSKDNAGRNIKQRQIQHPDFQNVTFNGARRYLEGKGQGSDFLIRPSSQGTDHLTITIQFFEEIYLNVDITELNASVGLSPTATFVLRLLAYPLQ
jgi:transcription elongation factor SPT6